MARKYLKDRQILSLIVSLQSLWSSALIIHHRLLIAMITYKMQRKRLLNLPLTDGSRRIPKKSQIANHVSAGFDLEVQMAGGGDSIRIELHHLNGNKIFA